MSFLHLEKCAGPECPRCGCMQAKIQPGRPRWGRPGSERYQCGACGHLWTEAPAEWADQEQPKPSGNGQDRPSGVAYHVVRCPKCDSDDTRVYKTMRPIRYHRCRACNHKFKSHEAA